jgi:hypothetical protein
VAKRHRSIAKRRAAALHVHYTKKIHQGLDNVGFIGTENINGPASDKVPVHKLSHLEHRDDLLAVEYRQQSFVCADVALFLGILELVFADVLRRYWYFYSYLNACRFVSH